MTRTTSGRWCLRFVRHDNEVECLDRQACLIGDVLWKEPECRTWHRILSRPATRYPSVLRLPVVEL